jgi:hypothetical protein
LCEKWHSVTGQVHPTFWGMIVPSKCCNSSPNDKVTHCSRLESSIMIH